MTTPKTPQEADREMVEAAIKNRQKLKYDPVSLDEIAAGEFRNAIAWRDQNPSPEVLALVEALKLQKKMWDNLMAKGNVNWGHTFRIDFGLMNETLIKMDRALAQWEAKRKEGRG